MRGSGELQPAADHRAMQHGDRRDLAELDLAEGAMPQPGMGDALLDVALFQLAQIEAGGKMLALAMQQHGADIVRQRGEESLMPMMVSSSSALRLCGRLSRRMATSPCRSAASEAGKCPKSGLDDAPEFTRALLLGRRRPLGAAARYRYDHVAVSLFSQQAQGVLTSGQPPSFSGRNAFSAGTVPTTLKTSHSPFNSPGF